MLYSLWMHLVEGTINAHCGAEAWGILIVLQTCEDCTQSGSDQISRAKRDNSANVLHSNAVVFRRLYAQASQNLLGFGQSLFAPEKVEVVM